MLVGRVARLSVPKFFLFSVFLSCGLVPRLSIVLGVMFKQEKGDCKIYIKKKYRYQVIWS